MTLKQVAKLDTTKLDRITAQLEPRADAIIRATAQEIAGDAVNRIMTGKKTGRTYKLKGGKIHQASARGEAPATETGNLANSIKAEAAGRLAQRVNVYSEYGIFLELDQYLQRPFLVPAVEKFREKFNKVWADLFK